VPKKKRLLLVQPTRHQPKTAFSRLPPLHRADLEGPLRVRFGAFARLCRMSAICALRPAIALCSSGHRRKPAIEG
jgi:hypothetical protein